MISLCDNSHIIGVQEKKMCQRGDEEMLHSPTGFNVLLIMYTKATSAPCAKFLNCFKECTKFDATADRDK